MQAIIRLLTIGLTSIFQGLNDAEGKVAVAAAAFDVSPVVLL